MPLLLCFVSKGTARQHPTEQRCEVKLSVRQIASNITAVQGQTTHAGALRVDIRLKGSAGATSDSKVIRGKIRKGTKQYEKVRNSTKLFMNFLGTFYDFLNGLGTF